MKLDCYRRYRHSQAWLPAGWAVLVVVAAIALARGTLVAEDYEPGQTPPRVLGGGPNTDQAQLLVQRTIERLVLGDAFDAKLRQRIWAGGREVVGIGRYEQSGGGSGRFSLEMTIHDGDLKHDTRQISDGKLAWSRSQIGNQVTLRRVDLGRIDEFYRELRRADSVPETRYPGPRNLIVVDDPTPPWLRVGGLVELIDQIAHDYDLRLTPGKVDDRPAWVLRGEVKPETWQQILSEASPQKPSKLWPHEVRLAIAAVGDESGFGVGLPTRIEFWSRPPSRDELPNATPESDTSGFGSGNPAATESETADSAEGNTAVTGTASDGSVEPTVVAERPTVDSPAGRLISLLEIYAARKIQPSPEERFRFEREERDVTFSNDTQRYLGRTADRYRASQVRR